MLSYFIVGRVQPMQSKNLRWLWVLCKGGRDGEGVNFCVVGTSPLENNKENEQTNEKFG